MRGSATGAAVRALELLAGMGLAALVTASTAFASGSPLLPALPAHERRCSALHTACCTANLADIHAPLLRMLAAEAQAPGEAHWDSIKQMYVLEGQLLTEAGAYVAVRSGPASSRRQRPKTGC